MTLTKLISWIVYGVGFYNGEFGAKAPYLAAGGQYKRSALRANSIRKWIFTHG
jgi:hypothetical protein